MTDAGARPTARHAGLKVLVCITGISGGGSEQSLAELIPGFIAAGIDVHVAYFVARSEDPIEQFAAHGVGVHHIEERSLLGRARALRRIIRRERPDLVHTTLFDADIAGRLAAWGTGVPVLSSLVNDTYGQARQTDPNVARSQASAGPARRRADRSPPHSPLPRQFRSGPGIGDSSSEGST